MEGIMEPGRLVRLALIDIRLGLKALLIAAGAVAGTIVVVNLTSVAAGAGGTGELHRTLFPFVLMLVGHIITSVSFADLHDRLRGYAYLTLPASVLEKFVVRLVLTGVVTAVGLAVLYWMAAAAGVGLTMLVFGRAHRLVSPFAPWVWDVIRVYLITQSGTLLGAVYFRRLHLVKTVLVVGAVATVLGVALSLAALAVLRSHGYQGALILRFGREWGAGWNSMTPAGRAAAGSLQRLSETVSRVSTFIFNWPLAPLLWAGGFLRLRRTQV